MIGGATKLRIAEIFVSVQGEGQWVGVPSVFVRVSGCNLRCVWCDTPYASWFPEGETVSIDEVSQRVTEFDTRHVVLTGGEPMLFEGTQDLAERLVGSGHVVTIETAGTVFRDVPCHLMSISPKLANSRPTGEWHDRHESVRLDRGPLVKLIESFNFQLKFVVNPELDGDDFAEIDLLLAGLPQIEPGNILVMAEGTEAEVLHRRERLLVPELVRRGWRLCPRLQIDLFGNTRGT